jgi:glycosyltransferase involved in cell wall biosynthesis
MKISVICSTYNRHDRHANVYAAFAHQTYEDRELLVVDDSPDGRPSPFFSNLNDSRVTYKNVTTHFTLGYKSNVLVDMATGEIIVHFDDDDYYAPTYLEKMAALLEHADFVKLSKWYAWRETDGSLWEWDTRVVEKSQFLVTSKKVHFYENFINDPKKIEPFIDGTLWGFGFSFVYRKSLWKVNPFGSVYNQGVDYDFVLNARKKGKVLTHTPDLSNLALHTIHKQSMSYIYPQKKLNASQACAIFGEAVSPWLRVVP